MDDTPTMPIMAAISATRAKQEISFVLTVRRENRFINQQFRRKRGLDEHRPTRPAPSAGTILTSCVNLIRKEQQVTMEPACAMQENNKREIGEIADMGVGAGNLGYRGQTAISASVPAPQLALLSNGVRPRSPICATVLQSRRAPHLKSDLWGDRGLTSPATQR